MQKTTVQKVLAVGVVAALVGGLVYWKGAKEPPPNTPPAKIEPTAKADDKTPVDDQDKKEPRLVLGRVWFDKLPEKRTDEIEVVIFFGGGIGITDKGSIYKSTMEIFDFERQKDRFDITFLHDKKKAAVSFKVESCDEKPPFDACLTFDPPLAGRKKLYGFLRDEEMDNQAPWIKEWKRSAEVRSKTGR